MNFRALLILGVLVSSLGHAQTLRREQWGAPLVDVKHANGEWIIAGKKNRVTLNETNLAVLVQNGTARWAMVSSGPKDLLVSANGKSAFVQLSRAKFQIAP